MYLRQAAVYSVEGWEVFASRIGSVSCHHHVGNLDEGATDCSRNTRFILIISQRRV